MADSWLKRGDTERGRWKRKCSKENERGRKSMKDKEFTVVEVEKVGNIYLEGRILIERWSVGCE